MQTEEHVMNIAQMVAGDPQNPVVLTPQSDLAKELKLTWVDKHELLLELEDQLNIPPPEDARETAQRLELSGVPWVVSELAKYLDSRKRVANV